VTTVEDLVREVADLKDRQAILEVINRHARGCDRHDAVLIASTYWADGVDEHGVTINAGSDYGAWANEVHAATSSAHLHHITSHTCEIAGDIAHAESYVLVVMLAPNEQSVQVMTGRYFDRFERRDGEWRIAVRRATVEAAFAANATILQSPFFVQQGYLRGTRDHDDLSYARPLTMDAPASSRWE
jgi:hypothetical protein